jgi:undecaprenyl-diphosphatase
MTDGVTQGLKRAVQAVTKLRDADETATHKAAQARDARPVRAAGMLAEVADQPPLIAIAAATTVAGLVLRRADLVRGGSRMLAAHLVATAVKAAIKHRIDRSRPAHEMAGHPDTLRSGNSDAHELNSFPSGHTAGAVAVARAASRDLDGAAIPATLAAGAVAVTQPVTGSHHFSDVVAGALIGWVSEALVSAAFDRVEPVVERALARREGKTD